MDINTVTVIGANGTMGKNVSAIFASFGNAKVYMVGRNIEAVEKARIDAKMSVKADAIEVNLIAKTYDDLETCVSESDLIFESVFEDINIKKDIYTKITEYIKADTIIATGTSGLSINELSVCFKEEQRAKFLGVHMFNPPYNMTLCEVIPSEVSDRSVVKDMKQYLEEVLRRSVVEIKDEPAFMGNRIGFQFINEALQYAERYQDNGGIDYVDSILGPFTGRNMAPLVTTDFVGLDVHKAIVNNVYNNTDDYARDTFILPEYVGKLISENKLGRKTKGGLYKTIINEEGKKIVYVYDIKSGKYRLREKYNFLFAHNIISELQAGNYKEAVGVLKSNKSAEAKICLEFLIKYVIYSLIMTESIGEDIHSADIVMATGFGWIPPLAVIDLFGGSEAFKTLAKNCLDTEYLSQINIDDTMCNVTKSRYDFRPFLKSRR